MAFKSSIRFTIPCVKARACPALRRLTVLARDRQGSPSSLGSSPEGTFGFEMLKFMQA